MIRENNASAVVFAVVATASAYFVKWSVMTSIFPHHLDGSNMK